MKPKRPFHLLASIAPVALTLSMALSQTAQAQATWVGDSSQDWNTAANWSSDPNNPTGNFTINTATELVYPILGAVSSFTPNDVIIGSGASQTGRLDHTAGSLSQANVSATGHWFFVGRETGTGTYNLADTAGTGGSLTGFAEGTGSLTVGKLWVGGSFNTVGTGTVNINTSGTINANSTGTYSNHGGVSVIVGTGGGTGTMNIDKGTINAAGVVDVASAFSNAQPSKGTLNIGAGGVLNCEGDFRTAFAGSADALGLVNLSGGTLNVGSNTERWIRLGNFDNGSSTVTVNSGNLNLNKNSDIRFKTAGGSGSHTVNLNGGAITGYSDNKTTANGDSVVDLMNAGSTATNTFNLNGGTLTVRQVMTSNDGSSATFNFNGGTLKATGSTTNFVDLGGGSQTAFVKAGGAIIDSNGFDVRIPQPLLTDTVSTGGGLTKLGAGTLTLSGVSTYTGPTTVNAGTLNVTGNTTSSALSLGAATLNGSGSVGATNINNTAAVISNGNANTDTLTLDSLAFTTTGTANLNLSGGFNVPLFVTNNLNIGAGLTVNVTTAPTWANGQTYNLIAYGTLSGSMANITKGSILGLGARQTATIGDSGSAITLTISGDTPVWTGAESGDWSTEVIPGSKNWELEIGGTPTDFLTNDQVIFDDSASGNTDIDISTANVQVASVVFNNYGVDNFGLDYTVSSTGGFGIADGSSPASLVKNGNGTVTLKTINSYTGTTTINAGTLKLGDGATDGDIATSSAIVNNGTLVLNRVGSFTYGNVISGFGEFVKNGAGTQILTGDNTLSGVTTINAGILQVGNGGTTGTLGSSAVVNDASLVFKRSSAFTVGNVISGTGSVSQVGTGSVTFSGFNSYSGGTTISPGGTILIGGNNALGTGQVTLANGVVLGTNPGGALPNAIVAPAATTSTLATSGGNLTLNGNISGGGNLNRTATGNAATVFLGGNNSGFTGIFTIENNGNAATRFTSANAGSAAARWVNNNPTTGRVTAEFGGGTIQFGSLTGTGYFSAQLAGINTIEVGQLGLNESYTGVLNQVGVGTLAVTKVGTGTWTLTGNNAYTGDTTVNGGVLATGGNSIPNTGKLVINGGKVQPTGIEVVDTLFFGTVQQASGTWGATGSGATHIDDTRFAGVTGVVSVTTAPPAGYTTWADANAPGQTMDQDHDNDGVDNGIEYFMGLSGSSFTANPAPVSGTVTWPMGATYTGVYGIDYEVQTSTDLVIWIKVDEGTGDNTVTVTAGTSVVYDMPTGGKSFVRLVVKN